MTALAVEGLTHGFGGRLALSGVGFMVESGSFAVLLGHPVYALSAVLVVLLASAGVGSLLTEQILPASAARAGFRRQLAKWRRAQEPKSGSKTCH